MAKDWARRDLLLGIVSVAIFPIVQSHKASSLDKAVSALLGHTRLFDVFAQNSFVRRTARGSRASLIEIVSEWRLSTNAAIRPDLRREVTRDSHQHFLDAYDKMRGFDSFIGVARPEVEENAAILVGIDNRRRDAVGFTQFGRTPVIQLDGDLPDLLALGRDILKAGNLISSRADGIRGTSIVERRNKLYNTPNGPRLVSEYRTALGTEFAHIQPALLTNRGLQARYDKGVMVVSSPRHDKIGYGGLTSARTMSTTYRSAGL